MTGYESKRAAAQDKLDSMEREALKLALEKIATVNAMDYEYQAWAREALAQLEQKPIKWKLVPIEPTDEMLKAMDKCSTEGYDERLYAGHAASVYMAAVDVAPTPPKAQSEQEPFEYWNAVEGWVKIDEVRQHFDSVGCGTIYQTAGEDRVPLYTAPPQCTWVEPTGNEWFEWWRVSTVADETEAEIDFADFLIIAQAVVAKLKEKNNG